MSISISRRGSVDIQIKGLVLDDTEVSNVLGEEKVFVVALRNKSKGDLHTKQGGCDRE